MWKHICCLLYGSGYDWPTEPYASTFILFPRLSEYERAAGITLLSSSLLTSPCEGGVRGDTVICPTLPYKPSEGTFVSWLEAVPTSGLRNVISSGKPTHIFPLDIFTAPSTSPLKQDSYNLGVISVKLTEGRRLSVLCSVYSVPHRTWHMAVGH